MSPTTKKPLVAEQQMAEFDPECELHHPLLIIKVVDPGCTLELQIENVVTGRVVRLTSGENSSLDESMFVKMVSGQFLDAWRNFKRDNE